MTAKEAKEQIYRQILKLQSHKPTRKRVLKIAKLQAQYKNICVYEILNNGFDANYENGKPVFSDNHRTTKGTSLEEIYNHSFNRNSKD